MRDSTRSAIKTLIRRMPVAEVVKFVSDNLEEGVSFEAVDYIRRRMRETGEYCPDRETRNVDKADSIYNPQRGDPTGCRNLLRAIARLHAKNTTGEARANWLKVAG